MLYIPKGIRRKLLHEAHDTPISGHLSRDKTLDRLTRHYYWPGMSTEVHEYCRTCPACQKNKVDNRRPIGLLQPLPIPSKPWEVVSLDLITKLPITQGNKNDALVVFFCTLGKMIHITATKGTITAKGMAHLFKTEVFRYHGIPKAFISDRDSKFTSIYWRELCKLLGTRLNMSTSHHPETDGQTERANRTIEDMLRAYITPHQNDWDLHLVEIEFAYNSSVHASTGYSPFYLNYGRHPIAPLSLSAEREPINVEAVTQFIDQLDHDLSQAKIHLEEAKQRQQKYANQRRRDYEFKKGDMVLLSHKCMEHIPGNVSTEGVISKLAPRNWGPFPVEEVINQVACRIRLPKNWRIHPVIHTSYLRPYLSDPFNRKDPPPDPEIENEEEYFHVEAFRNHRITLNKCHQLLVKWTGYSEEDNLWKSTTSLLEDLGPRIYQKLLTAYQKKTHANLPSSFYTHNT